jgi:hypothetical protein
VDAPRRAPDEDAIRVDSDPTPSVSAAKHAWNPAYACLWLGALAVGIVHYWLADGARGPGIFADEVGYMANARYLAGGGIIDMSHTAFYAGGWSLAIAPLSRLFANNPGHFYASVIATQAVLAVFSVVLIGQLCRWLFDTRWSIATLAACTAGLYTAFVSNSGFVWSESALTFTLLVVITASVWLLRTAADPQARTRTLVIGALVTGATAGYLVTVHRRTLAAALALLVILGVYLWRTRKTSMAAVTIVTFAVVTYAGQILNHELNHAIWKGKGGVDASAKVSTLLTAHGVKESIITGAGQTWYQLVATGGLVGIGVVALVLLAWNRTGPNAERRTAAGIVVAVFGLLLAVSVAFLANGSRADHVVYGRYVDIATPLLIAVGITWLATRPSTRALVIAAISLMVVLFGSLLVLELASSHLDRPYNRVTTLGILGWLDYHPGEGSPAILRATLWTAVIGLGVIAITYVTQSGGKDGTQQATRSWIGIGAVCAIVVCLFGWQLSFVHPKLLDALANGSNHTQSTAQAVRRTGVAEVALEPSISVVDRLGLEFWLPGYKFVATNPQIGACSSVVSLSRKPTATTPAQALPPAGGMYLFRGQKAC